MGNQPSRQFDVILFDLGKCWHSQHLDHAPHFHQAAAPRDDRTGYEDCGTGRAASATPGRSYHLKTFVLLDDGANEVNFSLVKGRTILAEDIMKPDCGLRCSLG